MLRVLIVEDQELHAELTVRALLAAGLDLCWERVATEAAFRAALARGPDVVISDGEVPGFSGMAALAIVRTETPRTPFIVFSGAPWDYRAQEALAAGAADFVCKADLAALAPAVSRAIAGRPS
jgi:DNA-binding NarL/FixJ family response regulator